jgi:hypothetical protein
VATSLQPGAKGKNCVGQLIHDALSLQGVLGYNVVKALNTSHVAAYITSVNSDFFTSKGYLLWPGNEQPYKTDESREICWPSTCGVQRAWSTQSEQLGFL